MSPARPPALVVEVSLCAVDGRPVRPERLSWPEPTSAASVLDDLFRLALRARRAGGRLRIDDAPAEILMILGICGLAASDLG